MHPFTSHLKSKFLGVILLSFLIISSCQEGKLLPSTPSQKAEPKFYIRVKNHPSSITPVEIKSLDSLIFLTSQSLHFALELPSYDNIKSKWLINDQLYSTTPNLTITTSQKFVDIPIEITQVIIDPLQDSITTRFLVKVLLNPNDTLNTLDSIQQGQP